jgi:hypothetical protein
VTKVKKVKKKTWKPGDPVHPHPQDLWGGTHVREMFQFFRLPGNIDYGAMDWHPGAFYVEHAWTWLDEPVPGPWTWLQPGKIDHG